MDLEAIIKALEEEQSSSLPVAVDAGPQLAEVLTAMHVGPSPLLLLTSPFSPV